MRAVLIALIGLALGGLETGVAVILTYYGVLIVLALPFLGLTWRPLLALAAGWAVLAPVVSQLVRPALAPRRFDSPSFAQLDEPGRLLSELLLTGYYPALGWLAYALLGLALGRLDLRRSGTAALLVVTGVAVAAGAVLASQAATSAADFSAATLDQAAGGMFGQTPVGEWRWLLVVAPHSTTPFDLLQTGGTAAAVIGLCLLVVTAVGSVAASAEGVLAVVFGAGTATLSLYTLHVSMLTETVWPPEGPDALRWHLLALLWAGALLVAVGRRGPLEWAVGWLPRRLRG